MDLRPAATVMITRAAVEGVEVLVLRRSPESPFLPGFVVFPGGAVDAGDEALAARLFGDPAESARACALRELYEEAGLLLTAGGLTVAAGRVPLLDLRFDPPSPDALVEVARWVAPETMETRFDTVFFATGSTRGLDASPDSREVDLAWWARPGDLLEAHERGGTPLLWPTRVTLRALAGCRSVAEALTLRIEQVPNPELPT